MWEFHVDVVNDNIKRNFTARTDMEWETFLDKVLEYFNTPGSVVELGYQFNREAGAMSMLTDEQEWAEAMARLWEKIKAAQKCAASMEIKNTVSQAVHIEERILTYPRTRSMNQHRVVLWGLMAKPRLAESRSWLAFSRM